MMNNILHDIQLNLDSSFLRDITADTSAVNSFNAVYNLEPIFEGDSVLATSFELSARTPSRQLIEDTSLDIFSTLPAIVVKDTFPLSFGHILCVPTQFTPSFNHFLRSNSISSQAFNSVSAKLATFLIKKANEVGLSCDQVILFEHGSGFINSAPQVYNACGTDIELCNTAVHAHLHVLPIIDKDLSESDIMSIIGSFSNNEVMGKFRQQNHAELDLGGSMYFSLRSVKADGDNDFNLLMTPNEDDLRILPGQLWRRVLGHFFKGDFPIDTVDYKLLASKTLGELRSTKIVNSLRQIHDRFWLYGES